MLLDPAHPGQLLRGSLQHLGQAAEMIQQPMGNGVGILPWNAVKQQKLQSLNVRKAVQPLLQKPLLQPVPVSCMN